METTDHVSRVVALLLVVTTATTADCGGDQEHFRLAPTRACLDARGFDTEIESDWLMKPSEGSLVVPFGRDYVALKFGRDGSEARGIYDAARAAGGAGWPIAQRANVAYVWTAAGKRRLPEILDCLGE